MTTLLIFAGILLASLLLSSLLLRIAVRIGASRADNGWDNAIVASIAGTVIGGLSLALMQWLGSGFLAIAAGATGLWAYLASVRFIYEVKTARAFLVIGLHGLVTILFSGAAAFTLAVLGVGGVLAGYNFMPR